MLSKNIAACFLIFSSQLFFFISHVNAAITFKASTEEHFGPFSDTKHWGHECFIYQGKKYVVSRMGCLGASHSHRNSDQAGPLTPSNKSIACASILFLWCDLTDSNADHHACSPHFKRQLFWNWLQKLKYSMYARTVWAAGVSPTVMPCTHKTALSKLMCF